MLEETSTLRIDLLLLQSQVKESNSTVIRPLTSIEVWSLLLSVQGSLQPLCSPRFQARSAVTHRVESARVQPLPLLLLGLVQPCYPHYLLDHPDKVAVEARSSMPHPSHLVQS